ncbi:MAG: hypothetical protein Q4C71_05260 [Microbacteriaceae bacterium]|nr:hypothetical protein [Microbacteriaceae bacterium]
MSWFNAIPAVFVAAAVLFAPGLVAGLILRARGITLFAFAPVISAATIALLSFVLPSFGIYWRPAVAFPLLLLIPAAAAGLLRLCKFSLAASPDAPKPYTKSALLIALALPAIVVGGIFLAGVPTPERISTVFDSVFHLNGARYVTETLNYAPWKFGRMINGHDYFYQDIWHLLVSLVYQSTGVPIPAATTSVILAVLLSMWPVSVVFLVKHTVSGGNTALIASAIAATVLPSFPLGLVIYGPVYTNFLGCLFLPVCYTFFSHALDFGSRHFLADRKTVYLGALVSLATATLAHPSMIVALLIFGFILAITRIALKFGKQTTRDYALTFGTGIACLAILFFLYPRLASDTLRSNDRTLPEAVQDAIHLAYFDFGQEWILTVLALAALAIGIKLRAQTIVALGVTAVFFSIVLVASVSSTGNLLYYIGSVWHGDPPRFGAIIGVAVIPIAGFAFAKIFKLLCERREFFAFAFAAATLAAALLGMHIKASEHLADRYATLSQETRITGIDKFKILASLSKHVPAGQKILGDPATGASLSYLYYGYPSIMQYMKGDLAADEQIIWDHFAEAQNNPAVCEAVRKTGVRYAVYFPTEPRMNGIEYRPKGLDGITTAPGMELVEQFGESRLYRAAACD